MAIGFVAQGTISHSVLLSCLSREAVGYISRVLRPWLDIFHAHECESSCLWGYTSITRRIICNWLWNSNATKKPWGAMMCDLWIWSEQEKPGRILWSLSIDDKISVNCRFGLVKWANRKLLEICLGTGKLNSITQSIRLTLLFPVKNSILSASSICAKTA